MLVRIMVIAERVTASESSNSRRAEAVRKISSSSETVFPLGVAHRRHPEFAVRRPS